ncbi:hypothetical protein IIA16_02870 [bacterium]|nr:hypothetical protein [bacterium]
MRPYLLAAGVIAIGGGTYENLVAGRFDLSFAMLLFGSLGIIGSMIVLATHRD